MIYRKDQKGNDISLLGYGCLRFPKNLGITDMEKTEAQILQAVDLGINYFDTAYIYPGSEAALGEILAKNHLRDRVYIASKLPHYLIKTREDLDRYFDEELSRLQTDHIDFYLMHMLTDVKTWDRLKELGIQEWIEAKKSSGAISQIGFSYHGNSDMFCQLIDVYPWNFAQIQYNYLDENSQAGVTGLHYAYSKNIPVVIMEPLRGGRLTKGLPKPAKKIFEKANPQKTPAEWGLQWLYDQKEIMCVLSGMNSSEMITENAKVASVSFVGMLSEAEKDVYRQVVEAINKNVYVACTGCRYCMPCPMKVDIPGTFAAYNRLKSDGFVSGMKDYIMSTTIRKDVTGPENCVGCGKCEQHCPQKIEIRKELQSAKKKLENPIYKVSKQVIRKFFIKHI